MILRVLGNISCDLDPKVKVKGQIMFLVLTFISCLYNNMCTHNTISSHKDHFEIHKRDSEESILTFVNLFPRYSIIEIQ